MKGSEASSLQERFDRWLSAPKNAAAYDSVARSYDAAALLRLSRPGSVPAAPSRTREVSKHGRLAVAASVALALAIPAAWLLGGHGPFASAPAMLMVSTAVGEVRTIELADGSRIMLDTNSAVELERGDSPRRAIVRRGRARFVMANSGQPFMVEAGATRVQGGAATFDVSLVGGSVSVSSLTGDVMIRAGGARTELGSGSAARSVGKAIVPDSMVDPAWPSGMLEFNDETLASAVGRANRYSRRQIHLASPAVAGLRVTGAYRAGDLEGLARSLAVAFELELARLPSGDLELRSNEHLRRGPAAS